MNLKLNSLETLQWNVRNIKTQKDQLGYILSEYNYHVLMLQSLDVPLKDVPDLDGFTLACYDSRIGVKSIDTAFYVDKRLSVQRIKWDRRSPQTSSCAIEVNLPDKSSHTFLNYYTTEPIETQAYKRNTDVFNNIPKKNNNNFNTCTLGGDFNIGAKEFSDDNYIPVGSDYAQAVQDCDLRLLNDGRNTRLADNRDPNAPDRETAIDLTLVSDNVIDAEWTPLPHLRWESDHYPIHISIPINNCEIEVSPQEPKPNYNKAKWSNIESDFHRIRLEDVKHDNINNYYDNVSNVVNKITDEHIPLTTTKNVRVYNPWWNDECAEAVQKEIALSRLRTANKDNLSNIRHREAKQQRKKVVCKAKLEYMQKKLEEDIADYRDLGKMWRLVKKAKRRRKPTSRPLLDKNNNNNPVFQDKDKARILAEEIASKSQNTSLPQDIRDARAQFEANFIDPPSNNNLAYNKPITMKEFEMAVQNIKKADKAPGLDKITYTIIKKFTPNIKEIYLDLFNQCLKTGIIPDAWKVAEVVAIPKPGKDTTLPENHRPISLTPHSGKIFERIINDRLVQYLESNNIIPQQQAGFRRFRSTTDNLVFLAEKMKNTLRSPKGYMFSAFFDVQKAFDRVWHGKLLDQLKKIGLNGNLYHVIKNFLANRYMCVKVGNQRSALHRIDMGTPQGAVLSPTLFCILLHDITDVDIKDCELNLYADDICLTNDKGHRGGSEAVRKKYKNNFQTAINNINAYMNNLGLYFSGQKTQYLITSRRKGKTGGWDINNDTINVDGSIVTVSKMVKYLGITFTKMLRWGPHISAIRTGCYRAMNLIKHLAGQHWCRGTKFLVDLVRLLIRSRITYGIEAFFGMTNSDLEMLNGLESRAIKIALGIPAQANRSDTYREVAWLTIEEQIRLNVARYIVRTMVVPNHPCKRFWTMNENAIYATELMKNEMFKTKCLSLYEKAMPVISKSKLNLDNVEHFIAPTLYLNERINPKFVTTLTDKKSDNMARAKALADEIIYDKFRDHLQIFTDGSVQDDGKTGYGIIFKYQDKFYRDLDIARRTSDYLSTFSVEMQAIKHGLEVARNYFPTADKYVVLTDSLSSLQALQNKPKKRYDMHNDIHKNVTELMSAGIDITICHIPSHVGIYGNEEADGAAKKGTEKPEIDIQLKLTRNEAYKLINDTTATNESCFPSYSHKFPKGSKGVYPPLEYHDRIILRKIRTRSTRIHLKYIETVCPCGQILQNLNHLLEDCPVLNTELKNIKEYLAKYNFDLKQLFIYHEVLGWEPAKFFCEQINRSSISFAF